MGDKQEKNGVKGEGRTRDVLLDHYIVHKIIPDIEGRDFMAELPGGISSVNAIIQSKFFENNNEVIIRKEYIFDSEGVKTEFFALLHTNDETSNQIRYFFTAHEIRDHWRLSKRKKGKKQIDYFVFKLNKRDKNKFEPFKGKTNFEINKTIEDGILKTDEYRNQKNIQTIKEGFKNPTQQVFENSNKELFKRIENKPIVDKLYEALSEFKEFRRIVSWRLIDKISFAENPYTSTHYHQFGLSSNHSEIIRFFKNLEIKDAVIIKKENIFNKTQNIKEKTSQIIQVLNENLIFNFENSVKNSSQNIRTERNKPCDCVSCKFDTLAFSSTFSTLQNNPKKADLWEQMRNAYIWFKLGNYEKAKELFFEISNKARDNKEQVIYFFAKFNERLSAIKNFDSNYPDLSIELYKLHISDEKKEILNSVADYSLFNGYAKSIDDIYLKIKDFKQRNTINDTAKIVNELYAKIAEYLNFFEGNWLLINEFDEAKVLFEKVIESYIVSYSMKTEFSNHLNHFDDFTVEIALLHCDSNKLIGYFQRNNVKGLPYKSKTGYLQKAIDNLISKENTDFLIEEICYINHKTNNPDLRRRVNRLFGNICILLTYLDHSIDLNNFITNALYFIEKLDYNVHDISFLAHPLLSKPELFNENNLVRLTKLLLTREVLSEGYMLTNCLFTLKNKGVIIDDNDFANNLIHQAISKPQFGLFQVLTDVLNVKYHQIINDEVERSLNKNFNYKLFYYTVISNSVSDPLKYVNQYLDFFKTVTNIESIPSIFNNRSPYTGINEPLRSNLNDLAEVLITINNKIILQNPIVQYVINKYPYYNFILNIDDFNQGDDFNANWILENQSEIVLKKLSENDLVKNSLISFLKKRHDEKLSKVFIKYFMH
ncbi:MAG: hypothetical protein JXL97_14305 [Bacteroidales bacterium]|nr:hypothetical protein [Bacteroidales bacterium]